MRVFVGTLMSVALSSAAASAQGYYLPQQGILDHHYRGPGSYAHRYQGTTPVTPTVPTTPIYPVQPTLPPAYYVPPGTSYYGVPGFYGYYDPYVYRGVESYRTGPAISWPNYSGAIRGTTRQVYRYPYGYGY